MQIVIDIPDEVYQDIQARDWKNPIWARDSLMRYIHEGVVLPEHHGRLIDADALSKDDDVTEWLSLNAVRTGKMLKRFSELFIKKINDAPTIIEATEEVD